jgi:anti-sigma factor RsiW
MRHAQVDSLIDRLVVGACSPAEARAVASHAIGCARCTVRIATARRLSTALGSAPVLRAPPGFAAKVMNQVYRQALAGQPAAEEAPGARRRSLSTMYRRVAFSFMVTAFVLMASLVIPRAAYTSLIAARGADAGVGGSTAVQGVLQSADKAVRGILGEQQVGGNGE